MSGKVDVIKQTMDMLHDFRLTASNLFHCYRKLQDDKYYTSLILESKSHHLREWRKDDEYKAELQRDVAELTEKLALIKKELSDKEDEMLVHLWGPYYNNPTTNTKGDI